MRATNEVIFRARDLEKVRAYYEGVLGFPIVLEKDGMIGFDSGALNLYFERGEPNGAVFEYAVEDLQRAKNDLVAAGCTIVEENPAVPRVYLRDPFGLVFNISDE
jgi:catechol 2,3-dioxygenase-like lactoylglutathione lyase family enzyme